MFKINVVSIGHYLQNCDAGYDNVIIFHNNKTIHYQCRLRVKKIGNPLFRCAKKYILTILLGRTREKNWGAETYVKFRILEPQKIIRKITNHKLARP